MNLPCAPCRRQGFECDLGTTVTTTCGDSPDDPGCRLCHEALVSNTVCTLDCGCRTTVDEERDLAFLNPCSREHKELAERGREPGSRVVVRGVR